MLSDERKRMNELCLAIQDEKDYEKFVALLKELSQLLEVKEQRRFPEQPKIIWTRNKPSTSMPAKVKKVLPSFGRPNGKVEISIPAAEYLFQEIRIENKLTDMEGKNVALASGAELTLTVEAEKSGTVPSK